MKTIGLIGGMSWESTAIYYKLINQKIRDELGGNHSAKCLLYSLDFGPIATLQHQGEWQQLEDLLTEAVLNLERAGADFIALCTNTMHKVADKISDATQIPFLHIGEVTAQALKKNLIKTAALLGTKFTMEESFLKNGLESFGSVKIIIPEINHREIIHRIIYDELVKGEIKASSREIYLEIINQLTAEGAQAIVFGCTEIGMLVKPEHTSAKLFDTTEIHAHACAIHAIS